MNKKHTIIISCLLLIGFTVSIWQYMQSVKVDTASAVTVGTPNPGHTWAKMECSNTTLCIDTAGGKVGIGESTPGAKLSFPSLTGSSNADGMTWYSPTPLVYGIYKTAGAWSSPNYQQLQLSFTTGIVIDGGSAYGKSGTVLQPSGGNVGIGVYPTAKLDVNGQIKVCDATATCGILQLKCYTTGCYIVYDPN